MTESHDESDLGLAEIAPVALPTDVLDRMLVVAVDPATPVVAPDLVPAGAQASPEEVDLGDFDADADADGDGDGDGDAADPGGVGAGHHDPVDDPHGDPLTDPLLDPGADPAVDSAAHHDPFAGEPGEDSAGYLDPGDAPHDPAATFDDDPGV